MDRIEESSSDELLTEQELHTWNFDGFKHGVESPDGICYTVKISPRKRNPLQIAIMKRVRNEASSGGIIKIAQMCKSDAVRQEIMKCGKVDDIFSIIGHMFPQCIEQLAADDIIEQLCRERVTKQEYMQIHAPDVRGWIRLVALGDDSLAQGNIHVLSLAELVRKRLKGYINGTMQDILLVEAQEVIMEVLGLPHEMSKSLHSISFSFEI